MFSIRKVSSRVEPPGLERKIVKKLPIWWLGGTVVPALVALLSHTFPPAGEAQAVHKHLYLVDALSIGLVITVWTAVLTVAIGCIVVIVMKGPRYEADSYPVEHASKPDPD